MDKYGTERTNIDLFYKDQTMCPIETVNLSVSIRGHTNRLYIRILGLMRVANPHT